MRGRPRVYTIGTKASPIDRESDVVQGSPGLPGVRGRQHQDRPHLPRLPLRSQEHRRSAGPRPRPRVHRAGHLRSLCHDGPHRGVAGRGNVVLVTVSVSIRIPHGRWWLPGMGFLYLDDPPLYPTVQSILPNSHLS